MALFSADLTVMMDAIAKVGDKVSRDYIELQNLQNSQKAFTNFTDLSIEFIKKKLFEYLKSKKPNYEVLFQGIDDDISSLNSDSVFLFSPLCGRINLEHAIPYFAISIALLKKDKDGNLKTFSGVIDNPITQETFIVEEGRGAFVNGRRIRVSKRANIENSLICIKNIEDKNFMCECIKKYKNIMITNCEVLNICNVAAGKYDATILNKKAIYQDLSLLLVKEAGGLIKTISDNQIIICNDSLYSQF